MKTRKTVLAWIRETALNVWGGAWSLIAANFLYFLVTLPVQIWAMIRFNGILAEQGGSLFFTVGALAAAVLGRVPVWIRTAVFILDVLLLGPATAALRYAASSAVRGRHFWVWPDLKAAALRNARQAVPVGILDVLALYGSMTYLLSGGAGTVPAALRAGWGILAVLYLCFRVPVYDVMVRVELPFSALIKDALIVGLCSPMRVLLAALFAAAAVFACGYIDLIAEPVFLYALISTVSSALFSPVVDRTLLPGED